MITEEGAALESLEIRPGFAQITGLFDRDAREPPMPMLLRPRHRRPTKSHCSSTGGCSMSDAALPGIFDFIWIGPARAVLLGLGPGCTPLSS